MMSMSASEKRLSSSAMRPVMFKPPVSGSWALVANVVPLSAGRYDNVPVPLLVGLKSVEKTLPMDQLVLLVNYAGSLFPFPHDMRKRLAESMFVGRNTSRGHIMADSCASFVLRSPRSGPVGVVQG